MQKCQVRVVGPLLFQATFNCAPYPPVLSCHPGCSGLLRWGVAVSPDPRGTSSPGDSYYPGAVPFLCPCLGSRQTTFRGPPFSWRRDLPQLGPEALPSVALPLPTGNPMWNPYLNELNVRRAMDRYRGIICPIWNHLLHANLNNRNLHSQKSQAGVAKPGQRR